MSNRFAVSVVGRIATDPALTQTDSGKQLATFRLAVEDRQPAADGRWETRQTVFHDVAAWGRLAEIAGEQLRRGDAVVVAGTMKFDTYQRDDGQQRTRTEIVAEAIGPDLRLAKVSIDRSGRTPAAAAARDTTQRTKNTPAVEQPTASTAPEPHPSGSARGTQESYVSLAPELARPAGRTTSVQPAI